MTEKATRIVFVVVGTVLVVTGTVRIVLSATSGEADSVGIALDAVQIGAGIFSLVVAAVLYRRRSRSKR